MTTRNRKSEATQGRTESNTNAPGREFSLLDGSITRVMGWPVEAWLRCQAGMLKAVEPTATGWIERRREAATAALNTFEKLATCSDLQEIATIHRDWLDGTIQRLDSDLHAIADHAVALSHEAMAATRYAAQTSTEVVGLVVHSSAREEEPIEQAA